MKTVVLGIVLLLTGVLGPQTRKSPESASASTGEAADLILGNGQIYTPGGWEQALAVRKGVIIAVGNDESVRQFRGPQTRVFDLHGDTVVPGLHDMHVHPMNADNYYKISVQRSMGRFGVLWITQQNQALLKKEPI